LKEGITDMPSNNNSPRETWGGFSKGTVTAPSPQFGQRYLAWMHEDKALMYGDYGPFVRIEYNVFVPSNNGTLRYTMSEVASVPDELDPDATLTDNSKIVQRLAAINGLEPTDITDLSSLGQSGYCIVLVGKNKNGFTDISTVEPLPARFNIPSDVVDNPDVKASDMLSLSREPGF